MSYKKGEELGIINNMTSSHNVTDPALQYIKDQNNTEKIEQDTTFLSLVCIKDPVKDNVKESILLAK